MYLSLTAISYFFLTIPLGLLAYRFLGYWKQRKDTTSKFFFLSAACLFSFTFVRLISTTLFLNNPAVLIASMPLVLFFEGLAASFIGYLYVYLKLSKTYAWTGFAIVFLLTLAAVLMSFNMQYNPTIEKWGVISWGFPTGTFGVLYLIFRTVIIVVPFVSLIVVLLQQARESSDPIVKKRSMGLSLVLMGGVIIGLVDFILNNIFRLGLIWRDIFITLTGVLLFIVIFITQKPPEQIK
jgi:hypothetical protein